MSGGTDTHVRHRLRRVPLRHRCWRGGTLRCRGGAVVCGRRHVSYVVSRGRRRHYYDVFHSVLPSRVDAPATLTIDEPAFPVARIQAREVGREPVERMHYVE